MDDVRELGKAAPFAWSTYEFTRDGDLVCLPSDGRAGGRQGCRQRRLDRREIVAFRLHLPSKIRYHNTGRGVDRGNILVWEQPLAERLRGVPLVLDARMDPQSILYRTLWLFGWTFVAVASRSAS